MTQARQLLSDKGGLEADWYSDHNVIRKAGNLAWEGVFMALNAVLKNKKIPITNPNPLLHDYMEAATKLDEEIDIRIESAYDSLYLTMGCDGNLLYDIVQASLESGDYIIDWCERKMKEK